jgi:type II secretory pathway component GspD/PulD (secretin)
MKAKLAIVTIVGLTACTLALAQNEPAAEPSAAPPAPAAAAPAGPATIPLIQFQDVPLTTAIDNLARQASINYILDPKVGYGQPDERGQLRGQPNISIRWENLTAEQALNALITTYGLQLVQDPKTKIARVTVKDPAAAEPLQTRVIQLKYAAPSNILASVQTVLSDKRSKVMADVRTSQLVVSATEKELDAVATLVKSLDTATKQVLIEAKLVETSLNPSTVKGINWSGTLKDQTVTFGNNALPGTAATPASTDPVTGLVTPGTPGSIGGILGDPKILMNDAAGAFKFNPATAFLNADGLSATLSFLNESADSKVIATPRAVTLDNEMADLSVTRATPIFKNTAGTQGSPGGSEVTYTNLGVILQVTPRISANDYVNLHIVPEVSRVFTTVEKVVAGTRNQADVYDIRRMDTRVMIPSGNTLVLGGLVSDGTKKGSVKVPVLGDIPWIGLLFRQDSKSRDQQNLIIFITPTIVQDTDFHVTKSTFLKTSPDETQQDKPWSAWDDGNPKDWSKPSTTEPVFK